MPPYKSSFLRNIPYIFLPRKNNIYYMYVVHEFLSLTFFLYVIYFTSWQDNETLL